MFVALVMLSPIHTQALRRALECESLAGINNTARCCATACFAKTAETCSYLVNEKNKAWRLWYDTQRLFVAMRALLANAGFTHCFLDRVHDILQCWALRLLIHSRELYTVFRFQEDTCHNKTNLRQFGLRNLAKPNTRDSDGIHY